MKLPKIAILQISSPRSGSTLLANIINSNENIALFNEIFARSHYLLPDYDFKFKNNLKYSKELRNNLLSLYKLTFPNIESKFLRVIITIIIKLVNRIFFTLGYKKVSFVKSIYHINSMHQPLFKPLIDSTFKKKIEYKVSYFKCIRMKQPFEAFNDIYKGNKIIFLIRNPYDVLNSTLKQRGLKSNDKINISKNGLTEEYGQHKLIDSLYKENVISQLLLHWRLSNEYIIDELETLEEDQFMIVRFEDFVENKKKISEEIFAFANLNMSKQTKDFLGKLDAFNASQKHVRSVFKNPMDNGTSSMNKEHFMQGKVYLEDSFLMKRFGY